MKIATLVALSFLVGCAAEPDPAARARHGAPEPSEPTSSTGRDTSPPPTTAPEPLVFEHDCLLDAPAGETSTYLFTWSDVTTLPPDSTPIVAWAEEDPTYDAWAADNSAEPPQDPDVDFMRLGELTIDPDGHPIGTCTAEFEPVSEHFPKHYPWRYLSLVVQP